MKKNSGFVLFEALVVSTLVLGTLIFLYIQLTNFKDSYNKSFKYNTISGLYKASVLSNYLEDTGYSDIVANLNENGYLDITDCVYVSSMCTKILFETGIEKVDFTTNDITGFKNNMPSGLSKNFKEFINRLSTTKEVGNYRLIISYSDGTFASIAVGEDNTTKLEYTLENMVDNSGFETDVSGWTTSGDATIDKSTTLKKDSTVSLTFTTNSNTASSVKQNITLTQNHTYYLSEYVYTKTKIEDDKGYLNVVLGSNEVARISFSDLSANKWTRLSTTFKVTTGGSYSLNVANLEVAGTVNIDNIVLVDLTDDFNGLEPSKNWCDKNIKYFNATLKVYK